MPPHKGTVRGVDGGDPTGRQRFSHGFGQDDSDATAIAVKARMRDRHQRAVAVAVLWF